MTEKTVEIRVWQIDRASGYAKLISLEYAIERLQNWWKPESIEPMLLNGQVMLTPYYTYYANTYDLHSLWLQQQ